MIVPLLFVAVVAAATLQSATGFGFGLLAAPILYAVIDPQPAVGLLTVLSMDVNLMTLFTERRRPRPLVREAVVLVGFALPGALLGVAILRNLDAVALQVLLTGGILSTLVVRHVMTTRLGEVPVLP